MQGYNAIAVFNESADKVLMCRRRKNPYKGLLNFVGGKIESDEDSKAAAYRELEEETTIKREDAELLHLMDFTYYSRNCILEIYVGKLNKEVDVRGDENELLWVDLGENFFDVEKYAGEGNIGHIMLLIESDCSKLFI